MKMVAEDALRVHAGPEDTVWYGYRGHRSADSRMPPAGFVRHSLFTSATSVWVLGTAANARLIVKMFETRLRKRSGDPQVYVGSPAACLCLSRLREPEFVLQQLRQPSPLGLVPGYWHLLTEQDYNAYLLLATLHDSGGEVDDKAQRIFRYHPAWQAVSFIPTSSFDACCRLVCEIVDPRWYNHPCRPNRLNRLMAHLGLFPSNFDRSSGRCPEGGRHLERARLVLAAWSGGAPNNVDSREPRNFLWRIFLRNAQDYGLLRASRRFVQFLSLVWLQQLAGKAKPVFDPQSFFKQSSEIEAYEQHTARLSVP